MRVRQAAPSEARKMVVEGIAFFDPWGDDNAYQASGHHTGKVNLVRTPDGWRAWQVRAVPQALGGGRTTTRWVPGNAYHGETPEEAVRLALGL